MWKTFLVEVKDGFGGPCSEVRSAELLCTSSRLIENVVTQEVKVRFFTTDVYAKYLVEKILLQKTLPLVFPIAFFAICMHLVYFVVIVVIYKRS